MKTELIYLWIEKDEHGCFQKRGFNFSPCYHVDFDDDLDELTIGKTGKINVFSNGEIQNVTAIVGENGVGKSTMIQYLTGLSDAPFHETQQKGYEEWTRKINSERSFVAVFKQSEAEEEFKIINFRACKRPIWYKGNRINPYNENEFKEENYIGQISRICLSNGAYENGLSENLRSDKIEYATINNATLKTLYQEFYYGVFGVKSGGRNYRDVFGPFEKFMANRESEQDFQMFLDLAYYAWMYENKTRFCGKMVDPIAFSIGKLMYVENSEKIEEDSISFQLQRSESKCKKFARKLAEEGFWGVLVYNLIFELAVVYDTFDLKEITSADNGLRQCEAFLLEQPNDLDNPKKRYYCDSIDEIWTFKKTILEAEKWNNHLPSNDWGRKEYLLSSIEGFLPVVENVKNGHSFVLKYLRVWNLEMSSGERALLNLMSRLYFVSKIQEFYKNKTFNWNQNVILLIDEIDLYLHPEWQRRIVCDLLSALQQQFKGHCFQIILSTHSPIVLSDIPVENSIFLQRNEHGRICQVNRNVQTFGANIHTLYRDAFFLKDGLAMGEFAQETINGWIAEYKAGKLGAEEMQKRLQLIGEALIRKRLEKMLGSKVKTESKSLPERTKEQMLEFLERQKKEIETQIKMLKEL